jgi:hypothetical protein
MPGDAVNIGSRPNKLESSMKNILMLSLAALLAFAPSVSAKDAQADAAKDAAKAQALENKAKKQEEKGHAFRAGRAAKKAAKAQEKLQKDQPAPQQ